MLLFEFGIAGHQLGGLTLVANNAQSQGNRILFVTKNTDKKREI